MMKVDEILSTEESQKNLTRKIVEDLMEEWLKGSAIL